MHKGCYSPIPQCNNPCKGDWSEIVKKDLEDLELPRSFDEIKRKSKYSFKNLVKKKTNEYTFKKLKSMQESHSKMNNLKYEEIKIQNYFSRTDINNEQKQIIFQFRTRMSNFGENYRGGRAQVNCPLCNDHRDKQELSYSCKVIQKEVELKGSFEDIYGDNISLQTIESLQNITEVRKKLLTNNNPLPLLAHVPLDAKSSAA